jgi:hypothetical protein
VPEKRIVGGKEMTYRRDLRHSNTTPEPPRTQNAGQIQGGLHRLLHTAYRQELPHCPQPRSAANTQQPYAFPRPHAAQPRASLPAFSLVSNDILRCLPSTSRPAATQRHRQAIPRPCMHETIAVRTLKALPSIAHAFWRAYFTLKVSSTARCS